MTSHVALGKRRLNFMVWRDRFESAAGRWNAMSNSRRESGCTGQNKSQNNSQRARNDGLTQRSNYKTDAITLERTRRDSLNPEDSALVSTFPISA